MSHMQSTNLQHDNSLFSDSELNCVQSSTPIIIASQEQEYNTSIFTFEKADLNTSAEAKRIRLDTVVQDFDLKTLLNNSAIGKALLNWYTIKGGFDSTRQGYLVEIISSHFLNVNCM
uniref:Uncharacterized protein LOC114343098 n=1 Tax=Diabrotica virgifera virgifera TaxID=50390 RepID=A0A6P7H0Z6_DIAVI